MSFPRLVISGLPSNLVINQISVVYENDTTADKPDYITRDRYDVKRELRSFNVSGGTANRHQDIPYNAVRMVHTWIGHIDVITDSVAIRADSSVEVKDTVAFIKKAVLLDIEGGIEFTLPVPLYEGPDQPSLIGSYQDGQEDCTGWVYDISSTGGDDPVYTNEISDEWVVRDINVVDNLNSTSRVTFQFEYITLWQSIAGIVPTE